MLSQEIKVTPNQSKRTFTVRKNGSKYRTFPFSEAEFNHARRFWTQNDWYQFLKTEEYFIIQKNTHHEKQKANSCM